MAWVNHLVARHINQKLGGKVLGIDSESYVHFLHTLASFEAATSAGQP